MINRDSFSVEGEVDEMEMDVNLHEVLASTPGHLYCNQTSGMTAACMHAYIAEVRGQGTSLTHRMA